MKISNLRELFLTGLPALQPANNHPPFIKRETSLRYLQKAATGHYRDEDKCNPRFKNSALFNNPKYTHAIMFQG
jgi:hypothetical protein